MPLSLSVYLALMSLAILPVALSFNPFTVNFLLKIDYDAIVTGGVDLQLGGSNREILGNQVVCIFGNIRISTWRSHFVVKKKLGYFFNSRCLLLLFLLFVSADLIHSLLFVSADLTQSLLFDSAEWMQSVYTLPIYSSILHSCSEVSSIFIIYIGYILYWVLCHLFKYVYYPS